MYNAKYIIPGLALFLAFATMPFWYNAARSSAPVQIDLHDAHSKASQCVLPTEQMLSTHMKLLYDWRYQVVREGKRTYTAPDHKTYPMSLESSCLNCHTNKAEFCDKCHQYSGVDPNCWDCHVDPTKGHHQ